MSQLQCANLVAHCSIFTAFKCDFRGVLGLVKVPCCIIQTTKDMSVPTSVVTYMKNHLGGKSTVIILNSEGHLPHLSAPTLLAQALRRALVNFCSWNELKRRIYVLLTLADLLVYLVDYNGMKVLTLLLLWLCYFYVVCMDHIKIYAMYYAFHFNMIWYLNSFCKL